MTFAVSVGILATVGRFSAVRTVRTSILTDIRTGFGFVWREPLIRAFAVGAGVINVGSTAAISILVLHAQDNLHLDEVGFGLLLAAAVGGILGAQAAPVVIRSFGRRASVLGAVGVLGFGVAGMGWAAGSWAPPWPKRSSESPLRSGTSSR